MMIEEILDILYKEIQPKTLKDFWKSLSYYKVTYPSLQNATLKQVGVAFLKGREF